MQPAIAIRDPWTVIAGDPRRGFMALSWKQDVAITEFAGAPASPRLEPCDPCLAGGDR